MSDIFNDLIDITVIVDKGDEYTAAIQQSDLSVIVDTGDSYTVSIQQPNAVVVNDSTPYLTVADFASFALSASTSATASYVIGGTGAVPDWPNITNKPSGLVSESSQVDYTQLQNLPSHPSSSIDVNTIRIATNTSFVIITGSLAENIFDETRLIDPVFPISEYVATQVEYVVQRHSEVRTGTILANWSGSSIQYTDFSAVEIGSSDDFSFDFIIVGNDARLRARSSGIGVGGWTVQTMFKMFPNLL